MQMEYCIIVETTKYCNTFKKGVYSRERGGGGGGGIFQNSSTFLEIGLVVPGKYVAKGLKKHLGVLKNELDKRAIKVTGDSFASS